MDLLRFNPLVNFPSYVPIVFNGFKRFAILLMNIISSPKFSIDDATLDNKSMIWSISFFVVIQMVWSLTKERNMIHRDLIWMIVDQIYVLRSDDPLDDDLFVWIKSCRFVGIDWCKIINDREKLFSTTVNWQWMNKIVQQQPLQLEKRDRFATGSFESLLNQVRNFINITQLGFRNESIIEAIVSSWIWLPEVPPQTPIACSSMHNFWWIRATDVIQIGTDISIWHPWINLEIFRYDRTTDQKSSTINHHSSFFIHLIIWFTDPSKKESDSNNDDVGSFVQWLFNSNDRTRIGPFHSPLPTVKQLAHG